MEEDYTTCVSADGGTEFYFTESSVACPFNYYFKYTCNFYHCPFLVSVCMYMKMKLSQLGI